MRRTLYIKDDDYRYSFLYGHYVTLTNLDEYDWERIVGQRLTPLYVSVHATDQEVRRRSLRNPAAPDIMDQLRFLGEHGIEAHTQIVVTPGLNDGPHLERSVRDLATLWPTVPSVSIVPVGLTKHHKYGKRPLTPDEMRAVLDRCEGWQQEYLDRFGVRFVYPTDEWYLRTGCTVPPAEAYDGLELQENGLGMVRDFLDDWDSRKNTLTSIQPRVQNATLVTGMLFAPVLARVAAEMGDITGVDLDVVPVVNQRLGESITVAGLLMSADVIDTLQAHILGEVVILPRIMFDHPDLLSLDDMSPEQVQLALERPVRLVGSMHDVIDVCSKL